MDMKKSLVLSLALKVQSLVRPWPRRPMPWSWPWPWGWRLWVLDNIPGNS